MKYQQTRRKFTTFLPLILASGFSYPIGKFLFFSDNSHKSVNILLKNIKDGITYIKQNQTFLYKKNDKITIYDAHCTHMGCILNFNNQTKHFNCPCHKSRFDIDGVKLKGPAKKDLEQVAFKIKNKTLYI
jgi:cytochrome b6-f complex iron-sulfur subunit